MGSRDKSAKTLQERLKQYFIKGGAGVEVSPAGPAPLPPELERELGQGAAPVRRLRAMRDFWEQRAGAMLPPGGPERLWAATRDLLDAPETEARHAALAFLAALAEAPVTDTSGPLRTVMMRWLREAPPRTDDEGARCRLLHALTAGGRDISCLEDEVMDVVVPWVSAGGARRRELLELATTVVKFNAALLPRAAVRDLVTAAAGCCAEGSPDEARAALGALLAVVSYAVFPTGAMPQFADALCRCVNSERLARDAWRLVRHVLGADAGPAGLRALLAAAAAGGSDAGRARGAVFMAAAALWGPRRVPALQAAAPPAAVLAALLAGLRAPPPAPALTHEVTLALQSLLARGPHRLDDVALDVLYDILHEILDHIEGMSPRNEVMSARFHDVVSLLEQLEERRPELGGARLLDLVERCGAARPEHSVARLLRRRLAELSPRDPAWLARASHLAARYVRDEPRRDVRLAALRHLVTFLGRHRALHEDELLERVALPALCAAAKDPAVSVRAAAARAAHRLARLAAPDAVASADLLDLLERLLNRPLETDLPLSPDADLSDTDAAAAALLDLARGKLCVSPGTVAVRAYLALLGHVERHYRRPTVLAAHPGPRAQILELVCSTRVNERLQVGLRDETGTLVYSPCVTEVRVGGARGPRLVALALTAERSWPVLQAVLRSLPALLEGRPAGRRGAGGASGGGAAETIAGGLCALVAERTLPEALRVSTSELHSAALRAAPALAPHQAALEPATRQRLVRCLLKHGTGLRAPAASVAALTLFALEARDAAARLLPEVLLDLSKISDTAAIAGPMLEFLSTLARLPAVLASLAEDQYMSVFAILLPYTNPSRYNHYVVSLAHHVVAAWFLKCRLEYRRNFVEFILHGLHNYIILPFEEQLSRGQLAGVSPAGVSLATNNNQDSSERTRSSSLGSRAVRPPPPPRPTSASAAFHLELTETCVELLARHTFSPVGAQPQRSATASFLLAGGEARTWLVGHKLLTVTASGCRQRAWRAGLCERCAALCARHEQAGPPPAPDDPPESTEPADPLAGACVCWCSGWAEVLLRSATGDVSWVMRVQNQMDFEQSLEHGLQDVAALLAPSLDTPVVAELAVDRCADTDDVRAPSPASAPAPVPPGASSPVDIPGSPARHPVRRSNSSPEMSSAWRPPSPPPPPTKPGKPKKSELRVSCEAIPEERAAPPGPSSHHSHHALQKVASDGSVRRDELPPLGRSRRSNTISVMSPARRPRPPASSGPLPEPAGRGGGLTPGFVLLQLYHNMSVGSHPLLGGAASTGGPPRERPLLVSGPQHERTVKNLDLVPPLETYRVGVLYAAPGQHDDEVAMLRNAGGSARYQAFVEGLGALVELARPPPGLFLQLESGRDGHYTRVWSDDGLQVHFHIATAMPSTARDPACNEKRKHVGNDFVSIVYNDSGRDFDIRTIKGQLNFCVVVVCPLEHGASRIAVQSKDEAVRARFVPHLLADSWRVSDGRAPLLARQLALHCSLAALISRSLGAGAAPYASNALERLRIIKRLRARLEADRRDARHAHLTHAPYQPRPGDHRAMDDFTEYT